MFQSSVLFPSIHVPIISPFPSIHVPLFLFFGYHGSSFPLMLSRFILSTHHKDIGLLYFLFGSFAGFLGSSFSLLLRLSLGLPGHGLHDHHLFNVFLTAHAFLMIFFLVMPILLGGFGN
jgi:heme/copper-type cytochrome/quinol oxidase subunit 1